MPEWHMKRLRVSLKSPLKCGDQPFGFISRTLPFVPSHVPLMAMAPAAVSLLGLPDVPDSYYGIQGFLEKNMRFSPFFLLNSTEKSVYDQPLFPFINSAGLDRIESLFLSARYGIAMDYATRGAKDARLFEVESIQPFDRNGNKTLLEGYIFWRAAAGEGQELNETGALNGLGMEKLIEQSLWGGERNKGYGDVSLNECTLAERIWEEAIILSGDTPYINWPAGKKAPFYLTYDPDLSNNVAGKLQPLVGRIFVPGRGAGQGASKAVIVWDLGWSADVDLRLEIRVQALGGVAKGAWGFLMA
jgi:hypothetical protein